ncbi:MAG: dephospho-CoA kinase [Muribaculaceae bacterium]|nr:dephospho-CoA kinase [Muribaculaceae bacterium]
MSEVIAVVGGIGAGKSVVCSILRAMGYSVYDSDTRARQLMDGSDEIKRFLIENIHVQAVSKDGVIDRRRVAEVVFVDEDKRLMLNKAVHGAVLDDFAAWCDAHADETTLFVECAILCESGLSKYVDRVWIVDAPREIRIRRVCRRNGLAESQVADRITAQQQEEKAVRRMPHEVIVNDGSEPLLPAIEKLLGME